MATYDLRYTGACDCGDNAEIKSGTLTVRLTVTDTKGGSTSIKADYLQCSCNFSSTVYCDGKIILQWSRDGSTWTDVTLLTSSSSASTTQISAGSNNKLIWSSSSGFSGTWSSDAVEIAHGTNSTLYFRIKFEVNRHDDWNKGHFDFHYKSNSLAYAVASGSVTNTQSISVYKSGRPSAPSSPSITLSGTHTYDGKNCAYYGTRSDGNAGTQFNYSVTEYGNKYSVTYKTYYTGNAGTGSGSSSSPFTMGANTYKAEITVTSWNEDSSYDTEKSTEKTTTVTVWSRIPSPGQFTLKHNDGYVYYGKAYSGNFTLSPPESYPSTAKPDWQYHVKSTSSGSFDSYSNHEESSDLVSHPFVQVRGSYYCSEGKFVRSPYVESSTYNVRLNAPKTTTLDKTTVGYSTDSLRITVSGVVNSLTNPTTSGDFYYKGLNTDNSWDSDWKSSGVNKDKVWTDTGYVRPKYKYRARYIDPNGNYVASAYTSETSEISVKLNTPKAPSVSPSPVTVTRPVTASLSDVGTNPSSGLSKNYAWYRKSDNTKVATTATYTTVYADNQGLYAKVYLSSTTTAKFVSSESSPASSTVTIYLHPRNMSSNGFTHGFKVDNGQGGGKQSISDVEVVLPDSTLYVDYSAFAASKNLGLFNYYKLEVIKEGASTSSAVVEGTNTPSSSQSRSVATSRVDPGQRYYLKLSCYYYDSSSKSTSGPTSTAIFTSDVFLVGGSSDKPYILYPRPYTSDVSSPSYPACTCNSKPRLVFRVSNPEYLSGLGISEIKVQVGNSAWTWKPGSTSNQYFEIKSTDDKGHVSDNSVVVFNYPLDNFSATNETVVVTVINEYGLSESTSFTLSYKSLDFATVGSKASFGNLFECIQEVIKGYKLFATPTLLTTYPAKGDTITQEEFKTLRDALKLVYDNVTTSAYRSALDTDIDLSRMVYEDFSPLIAKSSQSDVTTKGNYFNLLVYALKFML